MGDDGAYLLDRVLLQLLLNILDRSSRDADLGHGLFIIFGLLSGQESEPHCLGEIVGEVDDTFQLRRLLQFVMATDDAYSIGPPCPR